MNIKITFPDGSIKEFPSGITGLAIAEGISKGLANNACGIMVNGKMKDLTAPINEDSAVRILTFKDNEGKKIFRHTAAHLMAHAIKRLYPEACLEDGPAEEDGFFYDIEIPQTVSEADFGKIEKEMEKIAKENLSIVRKELSRDEAITYFKNKDEKFKVETIEALPQGTPITIYEQGEFADLCRGPHLTSTGKLKAVKVMSIAGAYRKGDSTREQLQRIRGTAFPDKKDLSEYLVFLEEAKKRDHRKIGAELDLFSFHDEAPGFPFFHSNGSFLYNTLIDFCRMELKKRNYQEIMTPIILNEDLWHRSGHWDHYKENMYFTKIDEGDFAVKPMNCPGGMLVYRSGLHSYREFPMRVAEFGKVHRHELSGVLHGLFRVRCFTQDDAHVFCTPDQLESEVKEIINLIQFVYNTFGFENIRIELSTRPEKSIGSDEIWEMATLALKNTLEHLKIDYKINPGDGAFYGPKIDFHVLDSLKRSWQCGTIQADFSMPERFDLEYVDKDGSRKRPVMIHRAIFGSIERFLGIFIEHCAGNFPLWIAPTQVAILPITSVQNDYAQMIENMLKESGFRVVCDYSTETIGKKIRTMETKKIPAMFILGAKEQESQSVSIRRRIIGDQGSVSLSEAIRALNEEVLSKCIKPIKVG